MDFATSLGGSGTAAALVAVLAVVCYYCNRRCACRTRAFTFVLGAAAAPAPATRGASDGVPAPFSSTPPREPAAGSSDTMLPPAHPHPPPPPALTISPAPS